jgi:hypothetical protein
MGKTSLARKLAHSFVEAVHKSPASKRIPIYIPLNLLSSQQRIDGLLGSIFTSTVTVTGYSYPLFQKLNSLGHLVILLDGLDEMTHAMTWDDFQYNFGQISELITPRTKAIMFGRPNVFRDRNEYEEIVSGKSYVGKKALKAARRLGFNVLEIEPFSIHQTYEYLTKYITFLLNQRGTPKSAKQIDDRVGEVNHLDCETCFLGPCTHK